MSVNSLVRCFKEGIDEMKVIVNGMIKIVDIMIRIAEATITIIGK